MSNKPSKTSFCRILIASGNCILRRGVSSIVSGVLSRATVVEVSCFHSAKERLRCEEFFAAIFDIDMNDLGGPHSLQMLRDRHGRLILGGHFACRHDRPNSELFGRGRERLHSRVLRSIGDRMRPSSNILRQHLRSAKPRRTSNPAIRSLPAASSLAKSERIDGASKRSARSVVERMLQQGDRKRARGLPAHRQDTCRSSPSTFCGP